MTHQNTTERVTQHLTMLAHYWSGDHIFPPSATWRVSGVIFSTLVMFDGGTDVDPPQLGPGPRGGAPDSISGDLANAFSAQFTANPGIQAFQSGVEYSAGFPERPEPTTAEAALTHLMGRLELIQAFFLHHERNTLSMHDRLIGVTYALLVTLAGRVPGEVRWVIVPADAPAPHLNFNAYELHDAWTAREREARL